MLASYRWLCELAGFSPDPVELEEKFTFSGLEVAGVTHRKREFENVVIARIVAKEAHPDSKKLSLVQVDDGLGVVPVVCGASNCPGAGGTVVLARTGATFGDFVIEPRKVGGFESHGMLCSESELNLGPEGDGIMVLDESIATPGTPVIEALDLEDWIFELEVTPNRSDALYHRGLAREMCLMFRRPFSPPVQRTSGVSAKSASSVVQVDVQDRTGCPRYAASVVEGVRVQRSPFALRYRLHNLGIRPISNLVDITNSILMEYGQPLHAFDLDKIEGKKIVVRRALDQETMTTLDAMERTFSAADLLICDGMKPVAVAGVMGGLDSEVSTDTTNVLIECACFQPSLVRKTSRRLKLSSESSYRFERGVDANHQEDVLMAANAMVCALAGGEALTGIVDCYPEPVKPVEVLFRPRRYAEIMGHVVAPEEIEAILSGLGATVVAEGHDFRVTIPTFRPDMSREIDLIEEVARLTGMNQIEAQLPRIQCQIPQREQFESAKRAREILSSLGMYESVTYSFVPAQLLRLLKREAGAIEIANPLNAQRASMRTTLLAGLLENLKRTRSRYMDSFAQFEVARTYHASAESTGDKLPDERLKVAALLQGTAPTWVSGEARQYDYYDIKGILNQFCESLVGKAPMLERCSSEDVYHPQRCCTIAVNGACIGFIGELHPSILKELKLPTGAVAFELDLPSLCSSAISSRAFPLSEFPPMSRDVAVVAPELQDVGPVLLAFKDAAGDLVNSVALFDVYRGSHMEPGKKSVAFSVQYRSAEKTLTEKEVDAVHQRAVAAICERFSLQLR